MHTSPPLHRLLETPRVFAYGSLVDPRCLDEVLGHRYAGERYRARLAGYERVMRSDYPFPYIVAAQSGWVDGVVVMDLSPRDLQKLDCYEEVEAGVYCRELVEVEAWGCGPATLQLQ